VIRTPPQPIDEICDPLRNGIAAPCDVLVGAHEDQLAIIGIP
jgi:hypothetical protein